MSILSFLSALGPFVVAFVALYIWWLRSHHELGEVTEDELEVEAMATGALEELAFDLSQRVEGIEGQIWYWLQTGLLGTVCGLILAFLHVGNGDFSDSDPSAAIRALMVEGLALGLVTTALAIVGGAVTRLLSRGVLGRARKSVFHASWELLRRSKPQALPAQVFDDECWELPEPTTVPVAMPPQAGAGRQP